MRDGKKLKSIVSPLILTALIAVSAATASDGIRTCIVSVVPLEENRGGAIQMEATQGKGTLNVVLDLSGGIYRSSVKIYGQDGSTGALWIDVDADKRRQLVFTSSTNEYSVMLQQRVSGFWKDLWPEDKVYPWIKTVSGTKGSWTMESEANPSGTRDDKYWLDFGNGKAAGITLSGYLQDLE
jgi:hypothetical protein